VKAGAEGVRHFLYEEDMYVLREDIYVLREDKGA
jgi:hypothetical protein